MSEPGWRRFPDAFRVLQAKIRLAAVGVGIVGICGAGWAFAEVKESSLNGATATSGKLLPVPIHRIEVEFAGAAGMSKDEVIAASGIKLPDTFRANTLKRIVKSLYATGKFHNIRVFDEPLDDGVKVIIIVEAVPAITQVEWQGIDGVPVENLEALIKTRKDGMVSGCQLFEDAAALQKYFGKEKKVTTEFLSRDETKGTTTVLFKVQ